MSRINLHTFASAEPQQKSATTSVWLCCMHILWTASCATSAEGCLALDTVCTHACWHAPAWDYLITIIPSAYSLSV